MSNSNRAVTQLRSQSKVSFLFVIVAVMLLGSWYVLSTVNRNDPIQTASASAMISAPRSVTTALPLPDHIIIVIEENHSYSQIIGNPQAPYINSLANQGALFTNSHAITHPSQPNYLYLYSGSNQGTVGDECPPVMAPFTTDNLGEFLLNATLTFTGYSEDLPAPGSQICHSGKYYRKHNPWVNFSNVPAASNQPLTSFPIAANYSTLPTIGFVIPNQDHDMHDGTIAQGDTWLQQHIDAYKQWAMANNSLLIVTWDEDADNTPTNQIATIFVGPMVATGQYSDSINHLNVLRTLEDIYSLPHAGQSANVQPIKNVWTAPALTATVTSTPAGATFTSTPTPTATNTSAPNTATSTRTSTPAFTRTLSPTQTSIALTATSTPSNTPVPPTSTPMRTSTSTNTATNTTAPTQTPGGPTATPAPSDTPVPPTSTSTICSLTFNDVPPDSTFYPFIRCLACRGIINGYSDGSFRPGNNVTRGQLSKIISNSAGFSEDYTEQSFEDVPVGSTFYLFVERMFSREIINGYACGGPGEPCIQPNNRPYFRTNASATRGQIAKIDTLAAGYNDPPGTQIFEDVTPDSTFYLYVQQLAQLTILGGYQCGSVPGETCNPPSNRPYFRPGDNASRGQTAKIVANTFFPGCDTPRPK